MTTPRAHLTPAFFTALLATALTALPACDAPTPPPPTPTPANANASTNARAHPSPTISEAPTSPPAHDPKDPDAVVTHNTTDAAAALAARATAAEWYRQELIARFDTDHNGQLTDAERAALQDWRRTRTALARIRLTQWWGVSPPVSDEAIEAIAALRRDRAILDGSVFDVADQNGDGALSRAEGQAMLQYADDKATQAEADFLAAFDDNADRRFSPEEAARAQAALEDLHQRIHAGRGVDADADGRVTEAELIALIQRIESNDPAADLNRDGRTDAADLAHALQANQ